MVREIEFLTGEHPIKLFDVMGGTSIGGIIALGLAAPDSSTLFPRYSASSIVRLFDRNMRNIFGTSALSFLEKLLSFFNVTWKPRYSPEPLEQLLASTFGDLSLGQALKPVVVTAVDRATSRLRLFKSSEARTPRTNFFMRVVGRGTSAAPTFFPQVSIAPLSGEDPREFVDGGVLRNFPAVEVHDELQTLYPDEHYAVVSLGTGNGVRPQFPANAGTINTVQPLLEILMTHEEQDRVDRKMRRRLGRSYMRLQPQFTAEVPLDSADDRTLRIYEEKFDEQMPNLETVSRFLLINNDNWRESGYDRHRPLAEQREGTTQSAALGAL